jgi:D-3-phosphoglycerate dehydrogenase
MVSKGRIDMNNQKNEWHVACIDVWDDTVREAVRAEAPGEFRLSFAENYDTETQMGMMKGCNFILAAGTWVTAEMIAATDQLRMIQKWGIGVDRIDLDAARAAGIPVAITAGANASVVAEHAIMLMLAVYRRLNIVDTGLRDGRWLRVEMRSQCLQLRNKTVGLYGFGNIGRMVARKLAGFDVQVIYTDERRATAAEEQALGVRFVERAELFATSDVVSLHLPLTDSSRNLIDSAAIAAMKEGAVVINTARGGLIDEAALAEAIKTNKLFGAGVDVFESEPMPPGDSPLRTLDRVVMSPHTAGSAFDNLNNVARHAFGNMRKFIAGEPLRPEDIIL